MQTLTYWNLLQRPVVFTVLKCIHILNHINQGNTNHLSLSIISQAATGCCFAVVK